ncbi:MAG TPA: SRPBCC family protein [Promineifilum sp.]|nr:SRPBCC family protein [Promineifilum sp.]HQF71310.1 SRPBCC family protein [Promineifilum sp.]
MDTTQQMQMTIDRDALTITVNRAFDAPRERVWRALTEPALIARWWGGGAGSQTTHVDQFDLRPGGAWRFVERGENGEDAFRGEFREVTPPQRIVQTFEYEPWAGHILVETMTLSEQAGGTLLTVIEQFSNLEDLDGMVQSGMEDGAAKSYRQLAELLATLGD